MIPVEAIRSFGSKFNGGRSLILPTTKFFFDKVLDGSKVREYRKDAAFYDRLFSGDCPDELFLHYRQNVFLRCEIISIQKVDRPDELRGSRFITTDRCYAISIKNPQLVEVK